MRASCCESAHIAEVSHSVTAVVLYVCAAKDGCTNEHWTRTAQQPTMQPDCKMMSGGFTVIANLVEATWMVHLRPLLLLTPITSQLHN